MNSLKENPFIVTTPEGMTAPDVKELFVKVFTDYPSVWREGHIFLHGPRGSGKSMIFRYLQPDCQCLDLNKNITDLPFFSIYIPLKNTDLKLTEFKRLEDHPAGVILNEHFMTMFIAETTFKTLLRYNFEESQINIDSIKKFAEDTFATLLTDAGLPRIDIISEKIDSVNKCILELANFCRKLYLQVVAYLKKMSFSKEVLSFESALCGYLDFLFPLFSALRELPFMPKGPIFLLIDDADNLNLTQTKILNTWVSSRTFATVSIKISTQLSYKTYRTLSGRTIDSIHDFSEINISTIYTSTKHTYRDRVHEIISKRLSLAKIDVSPEKFFLIDEKQEESIKKIADEIKEKWATEGRGYRPSDDATRYARPNYMKMLAGQSKSSHTYSYSGFNQLVHISSGVIRYFLEAAATMYNELKSKSNLPLITEIPSHIQDKVIREQSNDFFFHEFDKLRDDKDIESIPKSEITKLSNLIAALGGTFREILLSDRAERRVFSVAISDEPTDEVLDTLRLGEKLGYIQVSSIGNKEGTGRTRLYIMNRRLAPFFNLDPNSFAGYLFAKNDILRQAIYNPNLILKKIKSSGIDDVFESRQLNLFEDEDYND